MTFSEQKRARIREEESVRLQARNDWKRSQRQQLLPLMIVWTAVLTVLATVNQHYQ